MQHITRFTQLLLSLLTLAVFAWAGWQGYHLLVHGQEGLEPDVSSLMVIVAVLALVCTYMLTTALRKASGALALNDRKAALYQRLLSMWHQATPTEDGNRQLKTAALELLPVAGPAVIRSLNKLLQLAETAGREAPETLTALEELTLAIRSDLGQRNDFALRREVQQLLTGLKKT